MISFNTNSSLPMNTAVRPSPSPMSDEQKSLVGETLKSFDAENLTEQDALTITETFADAGIAPSQELVELMSEYDFDAKSIGDKSGMPPPPPPQPQATEISSLNISEEMLDNLNNLITDYYSDNLTDQDRESTLSSIKQILDDAAPEDGLVNTLA